ncbi:unnamed protein product, partial [Didymodactylos carnosus]
MRWAARPC